MKRRGFIAGLFALPFVAMFSRFAKAEGPALRVSGTLIYAYTWKRTADGPEDFRSFVSSDGVFTFPPECAGQPIWIPALMTDDATQWPKDAPCAIRSSR